MNIFDSYRLLITPLSPIHVGTGESYEPTNYVIEDGVLHEFDTGAVMAALSAADRKILLEIGNRRPDAGMIEALQRFFHERREPLMGHAIQSIPVLPGVANLYKQRIGQTANREADGKKVINRLEIDRTSFNPVTRLPVLFGSSLKGAIRTALLNACNGQASLNQQEQRPFDDYSRAYQQANREEMRRAEKQMRHSAPHMQQRLFQFSSGQFQLDPFRLLSLSDASWVGESDLPATQARLAVNRKKAPVIDAQGALRKSKADDQYQLLECIPGWQYRAFSSQLTVQSLAGLDHRHRDKLPAADLRFDMKQIAQACNAFYRPILDNEIHQMRDRGYLDATWDKTIQSFLQANVERFQRGEIFLLRVGRHSGAESVTLNGVRNIKIMKAQGQPAEYLDKPKTLWLAADEKDQSTNLLPFGWLLVELLPMNTAVTDWPELKAACKPHLAAARAFKGKLAEQQTRLDAAKAEAETKRREEEAEAHLAAQIEVQHQREEVERQTRRAAMSGNQRRVEQFKEDFEKRAKEIRGRLDRQNTDYHQRAQKLAKDALEGPDWTAEERQAAADAIAEWLPKVVERIDKDAFKKLKLAALRGQA